MRGIRRVRKNFSNREGFIAHDFTLCGSGDRAGVSAVVRVRNEGTKISYCLRSILPVFDEIVVVDNGSEDRTVAIVRRLQQTDDTRGKIRLFFYPYRLARFGPEHDDTPEDSVHSAVYYTNWSLSRCSYRYICKWDGDMVLARDAAERFKSLLGRIQTGRRRCCVLRGQTVYRNRHGDFFLAKGEINDEIRIFPYDSRHRFVKARNWERLERPFFSRKEPFADVCFFEVKFTDEDEFSHWSSREWPSERKRREWRNYWRVREEQTDEADFRKLPRTFLDDEVAGADRGQVRPMGSAP